MAFCCQHGSPSVSKCFSGRNFPQSKTLVSPTEPKDECHDEVVVVVVIIVLPVVISITTYCKAARDDADRADARDDAESDAGDADAD